VPLRLIFPTKEDLELFLAAKCLHPSPQNVVAEDTKREGEETTETEIPKPVSSIGFEIKSHSVDELRAVVVEGITVVSSLVEGESVYFNTVVIVRASSQSAENSPQSTSSEGITGQKKNYNIQSNLEITPVLSIKKVVQEPETMIGIPNLLAWELGAVPDHMQKESTARTHETRLISITLDVTLTHAFTIAVRSISGPSLGSTLVSLTVRHSNCHAEPVTITNIALHPGHSTRQDAALQKHRNTLGGQYSVSK
jgi:hypothetical protein